MAFALDENALTLSLTMRAGKRSKNRAVVEQALLALRMLSFNPPICGVGQKKQLGH